MRFFIVCEGACVRKILADDCPAIYIWNNFCISGHYVDVDFVSFFREKGGSGNHPAWRLPTPFIFPEMRVKWIRL